MAQLVSESMGLWGKQMHSVCVGLEPIRVSFVFIAEIGTQCDTAVK